MPAWYPQAAAARYWGKAPWELDDVSVQWIHRAAAMSRAEAHAQEMESK